MIIARMVSVLAVLCLMSGAGATQQSVGQENLKRYCTGDYFEHCGQFAPDGTEVQACFKEKAELLTPNCSMAIAAYQQEKKLVNTVKKISASR